MAFHDSFLHKHLAVRSFMAGGEQRRENPPGNM